MISEQMKLLICTFLISIQVLALAQNKPCDKLKQDVEDKYHINIYDKYNSDFFPYYWSENSFNVLAGDIEEQDEEFLLNVIADVLSEYPERLVFETIHCVYLLDSAVSDGGYVFPTIYTNNQSIYVIINNNPGKDSLRQWFKKGFEDVFFSYFPIYKIEKNEIDDEIKSEFADCELSKTITDGFENASSDLNVNLIINTCPGDLPVFIRQNPYNDIVVGRNTDSIIEILPVLVQAASKYPVFYDKLVNNIYLFPRIESNGKLIPSFSYFSDIYLSVLDSNGMINNVNIESELHSRIEEIICRNLLPEISVDSWRNLGKEKPDSVYNIYDDLDDIRRNFKLFFLSKGYISEDTGLDSITMMKFRYLNEKFSAFRFQIEKVSSENVDFYAKEFERKYDVNLLYNFEFPLQNQGRMLCPTLSIFSNPNIYQLQRALLNLDTSLSVYPKEFINKYLHNIYIVETMLFSKNEVGPAGTYSLNDRAVYISNIGAADSSLQKAFHHEFSSIVRKFSWVSFPKNEWLAINDESFSYYLTSNKNGTDIPEDELRQQGFLEEYSASLFDNDVEVFTSWLFYEPQNLAAVAKKHEKIMRKLKLLYDYYRKVDPNLVFDSTINELIK